MYLNTNQLIEKKIICKICGKEFESQISNKRIYCSENCFRIAQKNKMTVNKDWIERHKKDGENHFYNSQNDWDENIELIEKYYAMNNKIKCRCKKHGTEFYIAPVRIIEGQTGCKSCIAIKSRGENKIKEYLNRQYIDYIP